MTDEATTLGERDEIEMLLPWYVTGRLDAADKARVETWLARDASLARQLEIIEEERVAAVAVNEAKALPRSLSVEAGMRRAVPQPGFLQRLVGEITEGVAGFFTAPQAGAVRWATVAATLLIVAQGVWIGSLMTGPREQGGYTTASGGSAETAGGTFALVRFADAATAKDVAALLSSLHMTVVDGPKPGGLFRVRIGEAGLSDADRTARVDRLKQATGLVALVMPTR